MDAQWMVDAIVDGSIYCLIAVGFGLLYRTVHYFDFSFSSLMCIAAYTALALAKRTGAHCGIAISAGLLTALVVALAFEWLLFRRLREQNVSPMVPLLVSLGLFLVIQNCIAAIFGDGSMFPQMSTVGEGVPVLGSRIGIVGCWSVLLAVVGSLVLWFLINRTDLGRCIRAIGSDRTLAKVVGVQESRTLQIVVMIASLFTSAAGLLIAFDTGVTPRSGFRPFLMAVVVVVLARTFSIAKIATASLSVAALQHIIGWTLGSLWQDSIVFALFVLLVVLRSGNNRQWASWVEA